MKRILLAAAIMVLAFVVTACRNNDSEQEQHEAANLGVPDELGPWPYETSETPEDYFEIWYADFIAQMLQEETQEYTAHQAETPTAPVSLNLPITVTETTFHSGCNDVRVRFGRKYMYITSDGVLQMRDRVLMWGQTDEWEYIASDVRSFNLARGDLLFYIKNDNTLWGIGNNSQGLLGDGTGVNRDEPVLILENVADVFFTSVPHALLTDGTLMTWGNGNFYPVQIKDNVARIIFTRGIQGGSFLVQTRDGYIYSRGWGDTPWRFVGFFPGQGFGWVNGGFSTRGWAVEYHINSNNSLIKRYINTHRQRRDIVDEYELATDVEKIFSYSISHVGSNITNLFLMKTDGSLWAMGENRGGELGDGTKVPRNEPVHIADNVKYARAFLILKQDGTLWLWWGEREPIPRQVLENVAHIAGGYIYLNDGRLIVNFGHSNEIQFDNVKIPRTLTFWLV